ncbi:hypothetical protein FNV43_RR15934 [Rhamnella rubrinervis]|uniref:Uncharacterized protein n=1 Tax=Rhamnella rubrinervis TaxID=2594499 RepID=A0A8K0GXQ1_9ROSA|nr:hypothetical protein FNV43_RR15934 [Rhamnella rubrinervis]
METLRRKSGSGEAFSFPSTPIQDEDDNDQYQDSSFEFGCVTPDSPSSDPFKDSPADHLFFNGRLLPHSFPFQPVNSGLVVVDNDSRFTSRTSSISSKDSLMSSRSNSRSSSCSSSARTSHSDGSERKLMYHGRTKTINKGISGQLYGSSQRWQFITPVPASSSSLSRESSRRRKTEDVANNEEAIRVKKQAGSGGGQVVVKQQLGRRLFRWFVSACKECHAIEPSRKDKVLRANF